MSVVGGTPLGGPVAPAPGDESVSAAAVPGLVGLPVRRVAEIVRYRGLLWNLIRKDFEIRYAGSALGVLWTQLYPLLQLAVYSFVFTTIFRNDLPNYPLFLFVGLMLWSFFTTSLLGASGSIFANSNLITKVYFPRELAPLSIVLLGFVDLLLSHLVLVGAAFVFGVAPTPAWLAAPLVLLLLAGFCAGLGLIVAAATVYFHDIKYFLEVGLLLLFFLTPVFYSERQVPPDVKWVLLLNPMVTIIGMYRAIFLEGVIPPPETWARMLAIDALLVFVALHIFHRAQRGFTEVL